MVKFNEDEDLGKVIAKKQLFSFGAAPLTDLRELVFAAGGNKFSSLCGFRFTSKAETQYKDFFVAFVCKMRSKIYHNAPNNPSQWYLFKKISNKEMHVMDKSSVKVQYGFDVDKFFDSDLFEQCVLKFKKTVDRGLKSYVPDYVKKHGMEKAYGNLTHGDGEGALVKDVVDRYTKAIEESMDYIDDKMCNNKFYKLINYDTYVEGEDEKVNEAADGKVFMTVSELLAQLKRLQPHLEENAGIVLADGTGRSYTVADIHLGDGIDNPVKAAMLEISIDEVNVHEDEKVNEDEIVSEASKYECIVKDEGEGKFGVYEKDGNIWVATFSSEEAAKGFADGYPALKDKYLKSAKEAEDNAKMTEAEAEEAAAKADEAELDKEIGEALKEIYK